MRFTRLLPWVTNHTAWKATYDALHALTDEDSPEYEALDHLEARQFNALLLTACETPLDLTDKLAVIDQRGVATWAIWPEVSAAIDRDLKCMSRASASLEMKAAFERFAEAHDRFLDAPSDDDLCGVDTRAMIDALAVPCTTAGDFIVKTYLGLLNACGKTLPGFDFYPSFASGTSYIDDEVSNALVGDLESSDLGRCLLVLGRVDFDADAWVNRAVMNGLSVYASPDGLYIGERDGSATERRALRLVRSLLGGDDGDARAAEVLAVIREKYGFLTRRAPGTPLNLAEAA